MKRIIITAASVLFISSLSLAQTATPAIKQTQQVQEKRINQGIKSGEVTKKEAAKLDAEQAKIQHDKKAAKADGVVTPKEKAPFGYSKIFRCKKFTKMHSRLIFLLTVYCKFSLQNTGRISKLYLIIIAASKKKI